MQVLQPSQRDKYRYFSKALCFGAAILLSGISERAAAQSSVTRVEEEWELVIATPDEDGDSPQITTAMSPNGGQSDYCSFEINHQSQPSFYPGGLHLHAWDGEFLLGSTHTQGGVSLHRVHENIAWTQSMSLSDGRLTYEISNGTSETWSDFGGEALRVTVNCTLPNLNQYDPEASLRDTGVGYGSNRVTSLTLRRVRMTTSDGETFEINVNRDVLVLQ